MELNDVGFDLSRRLGWLDACGLTGSRSTALFRELLVGPLLSKWWLRFVIVGVGKV